MMQANEIKQRISHIERSIHQAAQACAADSSVPQDLKKCVSQMDQQSLQANQIMQSHDETRIRQYVDQLEELGDRARTACQTAGNVNDQLKSAVMQAHNELSTLKHQLH